MVHRIINPAPNSKDVARVSGVCPYCQKQSAFETVGIPDLSNLIDTALIPDKSNRGSMTRVPNNMLFFGVRRCPNPDCFGVIYFTANKSLEKNFQTLAIYPELSPSIETEGFPQMIADLMEEANKCFWVGAYRACAIMLRRALEEMCSDKGATGRNLRERIDALKDHVMMSTENFQMLHDLRAFGNDAAHVELTDFDSIGKEETESAMWLLNEVLRSIYTVNYMRNKFASLKKQVAD